MNTCKPIRELTADDCALQTNSWKRELRGWVREHEDRAVASIIQHSDGWSTGDIVEITGWERHHVRRVLRRLLMQGEVTYEKRRWRYNELPDSHDIGWD